MELNDRIIIGCGNFGGVGSSPDLLGHGDSKHDSRKLLNAAKELGFYQFDTANTYGCGQSELILGEWLSRQNGAYRSEAIVATKVGNPNGTRIGATPLCRSEIRHHIQQSLKRLQLERLNILYVHEPDPKTPIEETLEALSACITSGEVEAIGLSNVSTAYVTAILEAADSQTRARIKFVQNEFNLLCASEQAAMFLLLQKHSLKFVAFSPLAGGMLTGKYKLGQQPPHGSRVALRPEPYAPYLNELKFQIIERHVCKARALNCTPSQLAMQFVLNTPQVDKVVVGARRPAHMEHLNSTSLEANTLAD